LALWGVPGVPFHPDESTYLYMSRDFDLLFRQGNPAAVTWQAANQAQDVIRYRLLDGPLTHYLPGVGRLLAGYPQALPHDWDWSASWTTNAALGTLPDPGLLNAARWPAAALTVLSLLPLYGIGARLGGTATGLAACALYGLSGLVLLHGRRGMAEGPLLFFSLAAVWLFLRWPNRPILAGAATALAVAAKLTALVLLPVAGVALLWHPAMEAGSQLSWRARLQALCLWAISFGGLSWLVTPPLWSQPVAGLGAMIDARQQLLANQAGGLAAAAPGQVLGSIGQRLFAMLYHVYFAPPAFWDISNYAAQTRPSELSYMALPWQAGWHTNTLSTNLLAGGLMLALTLAGVGFGVHALAAHHKPEAAGPAATPRYVLVVLGVWSAATVVGLLSINIDWQRYYLPLVPIACLWAAYGCANVVRPFVRAVF
jgi:4-amino-4-deoxy-L-arabinose transferase-like glycosyltransferase